MASYFSTPQRCLGAQGTKRFPRDGVRPHCSGENRRPVWGGGKYVKERAEFTCANLGCYEEDLVDQLFNSSEKRLARVLLLLAHFGKEGVPEVVVPKISQESLAEMVGTTRSRVSFFMNRFRKLGFVDCSGGPEGRLQVHSSLLSVVLHD